MSYAVVAERNGLSIFNRADTAAEALDLAVARRRDGADAVYVRDHAWELVPVSVLERAVERERSVPAPPAPSEAVTVRVAAAPEPRQAPSPVRTGRVRVFKAAGTQRTRD